MNPLFHNYLILNKYDRDVTDPDVKELFGLRRQQKWPAEGMPIKVIQGTVCWVEPLAQPVMLGWRPFKLRAQCSCRFCGKQVPIGRLRQHVKGHADNTVNHARAESDNAVT